MKTQPSSNVVSFDFSGASFLERLDAKGYTPITAISLGKNGTQLETIYELDHGWIADRNQNGNIYYSLNTVARPGKTKPTEDDITWCRGLHVDLDCESRNTALEKLEMQQALRSLPVPQTVIVDSGNGLQALWLFRKPIRVTSANKEALKAVNIKLRDALRGDKVQSLDHLLRLPSTLNHPTPTKKKKGRVTVPARLLEFNERRYALSDFDRPLISLRALNVSDAVREKILSGGDADDRSEACASVAMSMVRAGHTAEQIEAALTNPNWGISERVYDKSKFKTFAKALSWLRSDIIPSAFEKAGKPESALPPVDGISDEALKALGCSAAVYAARDIPSEQPAIENFLAERKSVLLHGGSGAGKSYLIGFVVAALASGKPLASWKVTRSYRVLYIETEMDETEFHDRVKRILSSLEGVLIIRPEAWQELTDEPGPYIDNAAHQQLLTRYMQLHGVEFLVAEPLSWLLGEAEETSNDDTKLYAPWLRSLKNLGIGFITAHNEGWKAKRLRGASRILDNFDLTFRVAAKGRGAYEITRGKTRTSMPMKPASVILEQITDADGHLKLRVRHNKESRQKALLTAWWVNPRTSHTELAATLEVDRKTISRDIADLEQLGYLNVAGNAHEVTEKGLAWLNAEEKTNA